MLSIRVKTDRDTLLARIGQLSPRHEPCWGQMSSREVLCHLGDQVAVALGDISTESVGNTISRSLAKFLVIILRVPTPKGRVMTVPEMLLTTPSEWQVDADRLRSLISRLANTESVAPHPAFGALTCHQWGAVSAMHIDHHLRQFGV